MHALLQSDPRAMMDWIAVPNFLDAYDEATCRSPTTRATCASSAIPTRAAGRTACRSWCIAATPTIGHMFSKGFSIVDVRDPKNPRAVNFVAAPPGTWNIHLQTHDDLLLVINAKDMFAAAEFADEKAYYKGQLGQVVGTAEARPTNSPRLDRGPRGL